MNFLVLPLAGGALACAALPARADEPAVSIGLSLELVFGASGATGAFTVDLRVADVIMENNLCGDQLRRGGGVYSSFSWLFDGGRRFGIGLHGGSELDMDTGDTLEGELGYTYRLEANGVPGASGLQLGVSSQWKTLVQAYLRGTLDLGATVELVGQLGAGVRAPGPFGFDGGTCIIGRALRVAGHTTLPHVTRRECSSPDQSQRAIADAWLGDARGEAASVPAFLGLARDLERFGAPRTLVQRALRSAHDEARHTRMCSALAKRHGLRFELHACPPPTPTKSLTTLALEAWHDGCLAEGAAAERARRASHTAKDDLAHATQAAIAVDEAQHAELAWSTVRFALATGGTPVRHALADATHAEPVHDHLPAVDLSDWQRHGRLDEATQEDAWHTNQARAERRLHALL